MFIIFYFYLIVYMLGLGRRTLNKYFSSYPTLRNEKKISA